MIKVAFILHGKLKHKAQLKEKLSKSLPAGFGAEFHETLRAQHAAELSAQAVTSGAKYAIAVGGDGLLNEVANGYMSCSEDIRNKAAIGVFPLGTGNDFCKTIGIRAEPNQLAYLLKNESIKPVDVCRMRFRDVNHEPAERYYVNIADIGIGGYASQRVNRSSKILGAKLSYVKAIVLTFLSYRHRRVRVTAENLSWEGKVLLVVMANGRFFGSGLCIAPQADPADGKMQIVLLANVTLFDYLKHQGEVRRGEIITHPEVQYLQSSFCDIEPIEECTIDMDGEFVGYGPVEAKTISSAIRFLRP
jgi:YegS/Rv2252/BmrU family lipid kinase